MTSASERRLAAILAADVVGYSRLMEADEKGTHERLRALRKELIEPPIAAHHGRIVKLTGDGALVEFPSVVDAVECAVEVQSAVATRNDGLPEDQQLWFRVGINIGDIIIEEGDIYGDGVNVASRLEGLAEPGGICIARNVYNQVKNKLAFGFEPMGEYRVKNLTEPVEVYRVLPDRGAITTPIGLKRVGRPRWRWAALAAAAAAVVLTGGAVGWWSRDDFASGKDGIEQAGADTVMPAAALPLPDKPSIAVLPFDNLSGEERYERLADGITEDIITDLSRFRELFVIARNSTFIYKDQPTDVRQIARTLGVQYVLEGSLQAEGDRVRVTVQLVDASTGNHVWSERYERPLDDLFAVQDEVTHQIAGALGGYWGRLAQAIRERARRKPPDNLEAYELYLLGVEHKHRFTEVDNIKAVALLNKAITLDPGLARAYVALAWCHLNDAIYSWTDDPTRSMEELAASARKAVALDSADAEAHLALGYALFYHNQQIESGNKEIERALLLGPSNADVHAIAAWGRSTKINTAKEDITLVKRAMRLNPHYPEWYLIALSYAAYHGHEYEEVVHAARQMINPTLESYLYLALSLAELGQDSEASASAADLLRLDPDFSAERHINNDVFVDEAVIKHFLGSVKKAGLPICATEAQLAKYPDMERLPECEAQRASG